MHSTPQRNCFSKKNRLQEAAEFQRAFKSGQKGTSGIFKWFATTNQNDIARLGASVPKRHVKQAVGRNFLRRQIKESFRTHKQSLQGLDVVIVVRRQPAARKPQLNKDLEQIWSQVKERFSHNT